MTSGNLWNEPAFCLLVLHEGASERAIASRQLFAIYGSSFQYGRIAPDVLFALETRRCLSHMERFSPDPLSGGHISEPAHPDARDAGTVCDAPHGDFGMVRDAYARHNAFSFLSWRAIFYCFGFYPVAVHAIFRCGELAFRDDRFGERFFRLYHEKQRSPADFRHKRITKEKIFPTRAGTSRTQKGIRWKRKAQGYGNIPCVSEVARYRAGLL